MSRAAELARFHLLPCALGARLFPPSKWAGLFPSAAYRRSSPPQLAAGRLTPCGGNDFCGLAALPRKEQSLLLPSSWRRAYATLAGILLPSQWVWCSLAPCRGKGVLWLGCFAAQRTKSFTPPQLAWGNLTPCGGMGFCCLADFGRSSASGFGGASHEACRRMAVCTRHPAGSRTRPASREACRRAAVKPRPSRMSPERPARLWRAVRGAGAARGSACPVDTTAAGGSRPAAVNRNEDLTRQCQRRRLRLRTSTPACGAGGRRRRREGSEAAGRREGRRPWSGCLRSGRDGKRWRP